MGGGQLAKLQVTMAAASPSSLGAASTAHNLSGFMSQADDAVSNDSVSMASAASFDSLASFGRPLSDVPPHGAIRMAVRLGQQGGEAHVAVDVTAAHGLVANGVYVKLYLSCNGMNIRGTKQKTKIRHASKGSVTFGKTFNLSLANADANKDDVRIQASLWCGKLCS